MVWIALRISKILSILNKRVLKNTSVNGPVSKDIYPYGKPVADSKDLEIHLDARDCPFINGCILRQEMTDMTQAQT